MQPMRAHGPPKPAAPTPAQPSAKPLRMRLDAVTRGRVDKPMRVLLYGTEKVGKTTWASNAPAAIFICAEDGTSQLDVARFPQPETWSDVLDAIHQLTTEPHQYKTVVIDTLDWLERVVWESIGKRDGKVNIESYGYGKGYNVALDEWRLLTDRLDELRHKRGMHIVLLAHSWVKTFKDPESDGYDRYEMKLNAKAGGLIKEWCDAVLFAQHEVFTKKSDTGRTRGIDGDGARIVHTERRAAWDAGNRYGLPSTLPLHWDDFIAAVRAGGDAEKLRERVDALLTHVDEATRATANAWLDVEGRRSSPTHLAQMIDRLEAKSQLQQKQQEQQS